MPLTVLLDDDSLILAGWRLAAKEAGKDFRAFEQSGVLLAQLSEFPLDTIFYLDSKLSGGERGEDIAKQIFDLGYKNIFLATGYPPAEFAHLHWLRGVVSKDPPWKTK